MRLYQNIAIIIFMLFLSINNGQSFAETKKSTQQCYTLQTMKESPSNYELQNSSALYTKNINNLSPAGKEFAEKHSILADNILNDTELMGVKLSVTRKLNKDFSASLFKQLGIWKNYSDKDIKLKPIYDRELQVFNTSFYLQMEENIKWAVIDSTLDNIKKVSIKDNSPINESLVKSNMYSTLLIQYTDLVNFYNKKYSDLFTLASINHGAQENPNLSIKLPSNILEEIKPVHQNELGSIKVMLYDLQENMQKIESIALKTRDIKNLYKEMDNYSLSEIDSLIANLEIQANQVRAEQNNGSATAQKMDKNLLPVLESYISYYKDLKNLMSSQMKAKDMTDTVKQSLLDENNDDLLFTYEGIIPGELYYGGITDSLSNFAAGTFKVVSRGVKTAVTTVTAGTSYVTGKIAEKTFEVTDKASAAWDKGLFSDEYGEWAQNYDQAGQKIYTVSIKDTFINPIVETAKTGKSAESYQQAGSFVGATYATADYATQKAADVVYGTDEADIHKTLINPLSNAATGKDYTIGDASVQKVAGSFKDFDDYAKTFTGGYELPSQVILNLATLGGYGLAKDSTTLANVKATDGEKVAAGIGVLLAFVPALNPGSAEAGSTLKTGMQKTKDNLVKNVTNATDEIGEAVVKQTTADAAVKNAFGELAEATGKLKNFIGKADPLDSAYQAVGNQFDDAITGVVTTKAAQNAAANGLKETIVENLSKTAGETLGDLWDASKSTLSALIKDHGAEAISNRVKDGFTKTLGEIIEDSGGIIPFFASNTVNNIVGAAIGPLVQGIVDGDPNKQNQNQNGTQPASGTTDNNIVNNDDKLNNDNKPDANVASDSQDDGFDPGGDNSDNPDDNISSDSQDDGFDPDGDNSDNSDDNISSDSQDDGFDPGGDNSDNSNDNISSDSQDDGFDPGNNNYDDSVSSDSQDDGFNPGNDHDDSGASNGHNDSVNPGNNYDDPEPIIDTGDNDQANNQNIVPIVPDIPPMSNPWNYPPSDNDYNQPSNYPAEAPPNTDPNLLGQYLGSKQTTQNQNNQTSNDDIDDAISSINQNKNNYDQNRGTQNIANNPYDPDDYTTDPRGDNPEPLSQHVQNISQQTQTWSNTRHNPPPSNTGNQQSGNNTNNTSTTGNTTTTQNIPGYDGNTEPTYDGQDDDNDGMIDEGFNNGSCQIIIHDTGGDKDDQWSLSVDGQDKGSNTAGKTRNWDLNLSKGSHSVAFTGVNVPDNVGTYTVVFQKCNLTGGPSLTGENLNQGTTFTWTINVP